jgi:CxxC motif-containing protein (DUF1111 family)
MSAVFQFRTFNFIAAIVILLTFAACEKQEDANQYSENEWLSGGAQTVFTEGNGAFSQIFPILDGSKSRVHDIGDMGFEAAFVTAPAPLHSGLGPVFNNVSCISCHAGDGRGKPPGPGENLRALLIRISIPGTDAFGGPLAVPGFGGQLQHRSTNATIPEADVELIQNYLTGYFSDGSSYELYNPSYVITNTYMPMPANYMYSPRIAPPVFGLGLLEAVAEEDLLAYADEFDLNSDGISGKANLVYDKIAKKYAIGRFGWKAGQPTLKQQTAGAYSEDMGITNPVFPNESCEQQTQHDFLNDDTEISDSILHAVAFYVQTLAVPARRKADSPEVLAGKQLFINSGCASCHRPSMKTKVNVVFPEISNQTIFPYTDLLLHDMGPGLADLRPEYKANGYEWRTPPLWGIGLTKVVNGHTNFLHDGRARNLMEAIMWHGGEAEASKEKVRIMSENERRNLIKFLESL